MEPLKTAKSDPAVDDPDIRARVAAILDRIRDGGEDQVRRLARELDGWDGDIVLSEEKKENLIAQVDTRTRQDIDFAHRQIRRFADAQRESITEFSMETLPGVRLGQRLVPVECAGCYVPGGRYAHAASALMSVATAKAAGVDHIIAASPPRSGSVAPAVVYAMDVAGADHILEVGGVQAIGCMAFGLFGMAAADILVGPGNAFVAEAKRQLFGEIGIDLFAGPTESAIIADQSADPMTVAIDLASQAEHGTNSPVWLFTTSRALAESVMAILPRIAKDMPSGEVVAAAWEAHGEVIVCADREEMCAVSDRYACEHLQVMADDLDWWKTNLRNYGSLFLGEYATVTHGDKCSGTNHILPTRRAARYTGGLNVMKFLKVLTWQEIHPSAGPETDAVASRISRAEGMDGHARACDWRLRKYHPEAEWDFQVTDQKRYR